MGFGERLAEIEALVSETFSLWDEVRVGWSWRHYTWNHTLRVRALALALGEREGADPDVVAFAATLHDLTKRYDGPLALDAEGKRMLDADGYWVNQTLQPARENEVTRLYDALGLAGKVHHLSGAALAERLLSDEGLPGEFVCAVAEAIRAHVKPVHSTPEQIEALYATPEARVLHDADLLDANLGLVAFYRNIQIHAGFAIERTGHVVDAPTYVESVERWVGTKDTFVPQMLTAAGREVAAERQARNRRLVEWIAEERPLGDVAWHYGVLGVIAYLLDDYADPSLARALAGLGEEWLPGRRADLARDGRHPRAADLLARSEQFHELLVAEVAGRK